MLELRQRSRSTGSGGYQAIDTDDETDTVPLLELHRVKAVPKVHSTICKSTLQSQFNVGQSSDYLLLFRNSSAGIRICFLFSLFAIIFLSSIAVMLQIEFKYLKVSLDDGVQKKDLARGVVGAINMYVGCLIVSGYLWYRASNVREYRDDDLRLLD